MQRKLLAIIGLGGLILATLAGKPANAQTVSCTGVAAWSASSVSYAVGALVTYEGSEYKCIQANTSETGWDPVDVPALWSLVGTCSTSTTSSTTGATCSAVPSAPTGFSASGTTTTNTNLSWNAVTAPASCTISSYTIYKSGTSIGTSTSTSFAVTGLSVNTTYTFTVAATDSDGTGSQSSSISVATMSASCTAVPSAPSGLSASGTSSSGTTLGWSAVTPPANCSITSYTIYKSGTSIGTSTGTSFSVTGLSASTTYSFTVAATDSDGTGTQSSSVSVMTSSSGGTACWPAWVSTTAYNGGAQVSYSGENYQAAYWTEGNNPSTSSGPSGSGQPWIPEGACGTTGSCTAAPSAPTGLAAANVTASGFTLSWSAVTPPSNCSITSYTIYKGGTSIGTSTGTSFSVTGLTGATTNTFTVAASDSDGSGSQSASISVTTPANACSAAPSAPSGLAASGTTSSSTNLSWNAVTAPANCTITSYTIYQGGTSIGTSTGTTFSVSGLAASTSYTFTVAATDSDGTGAQGTAVSVTTSPVVTCTTKPGAPAGLAASGTTSSSTTLSWNTVTAPSNCTISGYTVYQGGSAIATVSSGTSYTVNGLSASTTYSFTVAAVDSDGTGSQSSSVSVTTSASTGPKHFLAGYWDNWGGGVPYINLNAVNSEYDIILVAFGIPSNNQTGPDIEFAPTNETQAQIISDIQQDHSKGQKVLLSLGGGNATITLTDAADINTFVTDVAGILNTYPFDGIDIDFENDSLFLNAGDTNMANPSTPDVANLITALNELHSQFPNMMLTFAPETFFLQLGYQFYGPGPNGAQDDRSGCQLPVINATRSWLSYVWTQEYQSGNIEALDNNSYAMGDADFLSAMTEMPLKGFTVANGAGTFAPLAQGQVAIGCGANANAVNGYIAPAQVEQAVDYLTAGTSYGGGYKLQGGPYPHLGGIMVWSLSWDNENGNAFSSVVGPFIHGLP